MSVGVRDCGGERERKESERDCGSEGVSVRVEMVNVGRLCVRGIVRIVRIVSVIERERERVWVWEGL
eukprot:860023-Prorocentrum_lima.AAC.1